MMSSQKNNIIVYSAEFVDNDHVLIASSTCEVGLWSIPEERKIRAWKPGIWNLISEIIYDIVNKQFFCICGNKDRTMLTVVDLETMAVVNEVIVEENVPGLVPIFHRRQVLVSGDELVLYNADSLEAIRTLGTFSTTSDSDVNVFDVPNFSKAFFAEKSDTLFSLDRKGNIEEWDMQGNRLRRFDEDTHCYRNMALSDHHIACVDKYGHIVRVLNIENEEILFEIELEFLSREASTISPIAITRFGESIIFGLFDGSLVLLSQTERAKYKLYFRGEHEEQATELSISKDDSMIISGAADSTAVVWNISNFHDDIVLGAEASFDIE